MSSPLLRAAYERGWDPRGELQALRTELGRLVGSALVGNRGGLPDVEMEQTDDGWTVVARLPGIAPEEVAVEADDRELCIRARSEAEVNADQGMPGMGSKMRSFEYRLSMPPGADSSRADAVMDHGLLTVTLPRTDPAARRSITVGSRQIGPNKMIDGPPGRETKPRTADPAVDRELHHPDVSVSDIAPQAG